MIKMDANEGSLDPAVLRTRAWFSRGVKARSLSQETRDRFEALSDLLTNRSVWCNSACVPNTQTMDVRMDL